MAGVRMGQDMTRDLQENMTEGERAEAEDTSSQEMKESNPAFLRYLQFKVSFALFLHFGLKIPLFPKHRIYLIRKQHFKLLVDHHFHHLLLSIFIIYAYHGFW